MFICYFFILRAFSLFFMEFFVENIPLQSITILLCKVSLYYFAKYYVILAHLLRITLPSITIFELKLDSLTFSSGLMYSKIIFVFW